MVTLCNICVHEGLLISAYPLSMSVYSRYEHSWSLLYCPVIKRKRNSVDWVLSQPDYSNLALFKINWFKKSVLALLYWREDCWQRWKGDNSVTFSDANITVMLIILFDFLMIIIYWIIAGKHWAFRCNKQTDEAAFVSWFTSEQSVAVGLAWSETDLCGISFSSTPCSSKSYNKHTGDRVELLHIDSENM